MAFARLEGSTTDGWAITFVVAVSDASAASSSRSNSCASNLGLPIALTFTVNRSSSFVLVRIRSPFRAFTQIVWLPDVTISTLHSALATASS